MCAYLNNPHFSPHKKVQYFKVPTFISLKFLNPKLQKIHSLISQSVSLKVPMYVTTREIRTRFLRDVLLRALIKLSVTSRLKSYKNKETLRECLPEACLECLSDKTLNKICRGIWRKFSSQHIFRKSYLFRRYLKKI